jgi:hypothetical protein
MDLSDPELISRLGPYLLEIAQTRCKLHDVLCTWARFNSKSTALVKGCDNVGEYMDMLIAAKAAKWEQYPRP